MDSFLLDLNPQMRTAEALTVDSQIDRPGQSASGRWADTAGHPVFFAGRHHRNAQPAA
jgi:hypothetical protein